ncbi:hypothetical protein GE061_014676 [Apolygus lucorum]|uniref:Uncharacterized protein n=1 Tax=Apolygus lucorum TaxID=248454 RepID=A0A8S9XK40_APOLU|nr:hypothetical protein GE061_014676 [Apolygus lucorum]
MVEDIPTAAVTELSFNTQLSNSSDLRPNKPTSERKPDNQHESPLTRRELQEIFNTKKPAAPHRPRPPTRARIQQASPTGENSRKPAKQPSCSDHRSGPTQQSPPDKGPLPRLPIRRRADKSRVLSTTTTAHCGTHQAYVSKERTPANMESDSH